jgi:hypothetical protein
MRSGPVVLWTALAALALVDLAACRALGLSFANWLPFLSATGAIAALGLVYGLGQVSMPCTVSSICSEDIATDDPA